MEGNFYSVSLFVDGSGYEAGDAEHLRESAGWQSIIRSPHPTGPPSPRSQEPFLNEILRERLTEMPPPEAISNFADTYADDNPRIPDLLESQPYDLEKS